jgi:hypothetical protein
VIVEEDHDSGEHARLFLVDIDRPGDMQPLSDDRPPYLCAAATCTRMGKL